MAARSSHDDPIVIKCTRAASGVQKSQQQVEEFVALEEIFPPRIRLFVSFWRSAHA